MILAWDIETVGFGVSHLREDGVCWFFPLPTFYMSPVKYFSSCLEELVSPSLSGWFVFLMITNVS